MYRLKRMVISLLFIFAACAIFQGLIGCGSCFGRVTSWDHVVPKVMDAVVAVDIIDNFDMTFEDVPQPVAGGTGFVISENGYVITNAHVVAVIDLLPMIEPQVWVRFRDATRLIVQDMYIDSAIDIAVLKINASNLPYLEFETVRSLNVGQAVMAIGNSYPFEFSVTTGVVSRIELIMGRAVYIQHSAAINFGCSGGPLINRHGKVVGINVALAPYHNDVYFAIYSDLARAVVYDKTELRL